MTDSDRARSRRHRLAGPVALLLLAVAGCGTTTATPGWPPLAARPVVIDSCAAGTLTGQGSSAQANAINTWIRSYQAACPDAAVEYASIGSGAGVEAFIADEGDFAGTDAPLTAEQQLQANARCGAGPAIHLPMVAGPITVAFNMAGVGDLRLRPATLARIFAGSITVWDDPAVVADNPDATLPATPVRPVHRADSSGTTNSFTQFLAATAGADWSHGSGSSWAAPGGQAETGNGGVAAAVARTDGAVGYVERSYALAHQLPTASIGTTAGVFVPLTDEAASRAVIAAAAFSNSADLQLRIDHATLPPDAYPLVLITYEVLCQRGTPAGELDLLRSFLGYTASDAGQETIARLGYPPLPADVREQVAATVAQLS